MNDEDFRSPDPSSVAYILATPGQVQKAIEQAQFFSSNGEWEWYCTYKDGKWSGWQTDKQQSRSTFSADCDFSIHTHTHLPDLRGDRLNFFPGPGDPAAMFKMKKPMFILTPDKNTLLHLGVFEHRYHLDPVWQRPGTKPKISAAEYLSWQPSNLAKKGGWLSRLLTCNSDT